MGNRPVPEPMIVLYTQTLFLSEMGGPQGYSKSNSCPDSLLVQYDGILSLLELRATPLQTSAYITVGDDFFMTSVQLACCNICMPTNFTVLDTNI